MRKKYLLYIHSPRFANEPAKSALVNKLLDQYYDGPLNTQIKKVKAIIDDGKSAKISDRDVGICTHGREPKLCPSVGCINNPNK